MENYERIRADIDLGAIANNFKIIKQKTPAKIMPVIKADAYGHGDIQVASRLEREGADYFGVAVSTEGEHLRKAGIKTPILIFGRTPASNILQLAENRLTQTVYSLEYARELSAAAEKAGVTVTVHIKVDTGMSRLGFYCQSEKDGASAQAEIEATLSLPCLYFEGIYTHFAVSEAADGKEYTLAQFSRFISLLSRLKERGHEFSLRHAANSGAIINFPETCLDMVRPGIILYGLYPHKDLQKKLPGLRPAMSLCSCVSHVKEVPAGCFVSYGRTACTKRPARLATVSAGYADGYSTLLSNRGEVLVKGRRAPIVGRVCMDQFVIDVTDIEGVLPGERVVLFGEEPSADELAEKQGLINYEIICSVSKRVPRIYHE